MEEKTIVRLSRPLLLASDKVKDRYLYKTIYGFAIDRPLEDIDPKKVDGYVGYLAAMHLFFNGNADKDFTINNEWRGVPDWKDRKGMTHTTYDGWMKKTCTKAIDRLNLSYTIIPGVEVDEETKYTCINRWNLIIDEDFYYDLEKEYMPEIEEALWEDDGPPF